MSRHEIGIDLIDIERIVPVLGRFPDRFRHRVLTEREQRYVGRQGRAHRRSLGGEGGDQQGPRARRAWGRLARDRDPAEPAGAPQVYLHGRAARRAEALDLDEVTVSISHERHMAVAVAVAHRRHVLTIVAGRSPIDHAALGRAQPPAPPERAHKGDFGRVLVVAGSIEYPGAALLAGLGGDARRRRRRPRRGGRVGRGEAVVGDPGADLVGARRGGARAHRPGGWRRVGHRGGGARRGRHRAGARSPAGDARAGSSSRRCACRRSWTPTV